LSTLGLAPDHIGLFPCMSFSSRTTDYKVINVQHHLCSICGTKGRTPLTSYTLRSVNTSTSRRVTCKCPKRPTSAQFLDSDQSCFCPKHSYLLFQFIATYRSYPLGPKNHKNALKH
jgi:hypothetical protein